MYVPKEHFQRQDSWNQLVIYCSLYNICKTLNACGMPIRISAHTYVQYTCMNCTYALWMCMCVHDYVAVRCMHAQSFLCHLVIISSSLSLSLSLSSPTHSEGNTTNDMIYHAVCDWIRLSSKGCGSNDLRGGSTAS